MCPVQGKALKEASDQQVRRWSDVRIVWLGVAVSTDGGIPLVSHTYQSHKPDVTQFRTMVCDLVARFAALRPAVHLGMDRTAMS